MGSFDHDVDLEVPVGSVWEALKEQDTLVPKILPEAVSSIEQVGGPEGNVGAIRLIKFGSSAPEGAFVKEKLLSFDIKEGKLVSEEIEGGHLMMGFTKWVTRVLISPVGDAKTKVSFSINYEGGSADNTDGAVEQAKAAMTTLFKTLEQHLKTKA